MVASMLRAQRCDPAKAQAKCAFATIYPLANWRIHAALAQRLITQARTLYVDEELGLDLTNTVYALDSTTIALCLSVFPWAHFRTTKAAVKMHRLDLRGNIPSFIHISDGKLHDVHALDMAGSRSHLRRGSIARPASFATRPSPWTASNADYPAPSPARPAGRWNKCKQHRMDCREDKPFMGLRLMTVIERMAETPPR